MLKLKRWFWRWFSIAVACLAAVGVIAGSSTLPASSAPQFTLVGMGQSNMQGQNPCPPSPLLLKGAREEHVAWCFYPDRTWAQLQDPWCGGSSYYETFANSSAGASVAPGIARRLLPIVGNMAFIPAAKGGTSASSWLYRPPGGMSYLDMAVDQVRASGLTPNLVLWLQGESDAKTTPPGVQQVSGAQYKAWLTAIADRIYAEFGCSLMVAVIPSPDPVKYANQCVIQQAQRESWTEIPHVVQGPDLSSICTAPQNEVHLAHPQKIEDASGRFADAIINWLQPSTPKTRAWTNSETRTVWIKGEAPRASRDAYRPGRLQLVNEH